MNPARLRPLDALLPGRQPRPGAQHEGLPAGHGFLQRRRCPHRRPRRRLRGAQLTRWRRVTAALDWWYSSKRRRWFYAPIGSPPTPGVFGDMETLPKWPRWLCWMFTEHRVELHWGDYLNDVSGTRCRCAKIDVEKVWN